jgi:hypothetical protein
MRRLDRSRSKPLRSWFDHLLTTLSNTEGRAMDLTGEVVQNILNHLNSLNILNFAIRLTPRSTVVLCLFLVACRVETTERGAVDIKFFL